MTDVTTPLTAMPPALTAVRRSPLHDRHVAAGAKFAGFGGFEMPLEYAGGGVLAEHAAVRTAVGLFDVSHLGTVLVRGPGARAHLDTVLSNDLAKIGPGRSQYSLCCNETGGVVDDLLVYLSADDDLLVVPNAANAAAVITRLSAGAPAGVEVLDRHTEIAVLAVQGPAADGVLAALGLPLGQPYGGFVVQGAVTVCRTGYTGERGYELLIPADEAGPWWDRLATAVVAAGGRLAGLAARDTLRTEMGFPLHGQDIGPDISPVQARLGWAVGWQKPAFTGRDALVAERAAGPARRLWALRAVGRGIPRPGMTVSTTANSPTALNPTALGTATLDTTALDTTTLETPTLDTTTLETPTLSDATESTTASTPAVVGAVTSGTFSPTLRTGIALALLDASVSLGDRVTVAVRGRDELFDVLRPPLVPNHAQS